MGKCPCSNSSGNSYNYSDYRNLKNENDDLKKQIKDLRNSFEVSSTQSSAATKPIYIKFKNKNYDLNIKDTDKIAKVLTRFNLKYPELEFEGNCYYGGKHLKATQCIGNLGVLDYDELKVE